MLLAVVLVAALATLARAQLCTLANGTVVNDPFAAFSDCAITISSCTPVVGQTFNTNSSSLNVDPILAFDEIFEVDNTTEGSVNDTMDFHSSTSDNFTAIRLLPSLFPTQYSGDDLLDINNGSFGSVWYKFVALEPAHAIYTCGSLATALNFSLIQFEVFESADSSCAGLSNSSFVAASAIGSEGDFQNLIFNPCNALPNNSLALDGILDVALTEALLLRRSYREIQTTPGKTYCIRVNSDVPCAPANCGVPFALIVQGLCVAPQGATGAAGAVGAVGLAGATGATGAAAVDALLDSVFVLRTSVNALTNNVTLCFAETSITASPCVPLSRKRVALATTHVRFEASIAYRRVAHHDDDDDDDTATITDVDRCGPSLSITLGGEVIYTSDVVLFDTSGVVSGAVELDVELGTHNVLVAVDDSACGNLALLTYGLPNLSLFSLDAYALDLDAPDRSDTE